MEIRNIDINMIKAYGKNNKIHPERQIKLIMESVKQFGFKNPVLIDKGNVIIAGHGRVEAAKKLGIKEVPCISCEDLTPAQVKAYRIADNKLAEMAEWDLDNVKFELDELKLEEFDVDVTGFNMTEITKEEKTNKTLVEKFVVPPFSCLDSKKGYWVERKKIWNSLIQDKGESRENALATQPDSYTDNLKFGVEVSIFDPVLAEVIYKWYGKKNCCVFDCFSGDSSFGFVTSYLGGKFTGIELRKEQVCLNNKRIEIYSDSQYICDDGRNILNHIKEETQDLLFSCPPYFNLELYSDKENDASNQSNYEEFYKILDVAFSNSIKCLKNNSFAVIVAGDIRDTKGFYYPFLDNIRDTFKKNGMGIMNELIYMERLGSAPQRASRYMGNRKICKVHQNVLVFYKGDPKKISNFFEKVEVLEFESEDV